MMNAISTSMILLVEHREAQPTEQFDEENILVEPGLIYKNKAQFSGKKNPLRND